MHSIGQKLSKLVRASRNYNLSQSARFLRHRVLHLKFKIFTQIFSRQFKHQFVACYQPSFD